MQDYYTLLEVGRDAQAEEIKTNYRRLAMQWHPDRNAGSKEAEERFKAISEAYSVLSDPSQRAVYDQRLSGGFAQEEAASGASGFNAGAFRASGFSWQRANDLFMAEMLRFASELTMQNVPWESIAEALIARGCPADTARKIARQIESRRKEVVRASAKPYFVRSALSGFAGLGMFTLFGGVGLGLLGFIGLIMVISAGYNLVRALYFMTTGDAPRGGIM